MKRECICPGNKVPFYCPVHGRVENPNWPPLMKETDRLYWPPSCEITAQAFDLDECRRQRDPDGERNILDLMDEYGRAIDRWVARTSKMKPALFALLAIAVLVTSSPIIAAALISAPAASRMSESGTVS